MKKEEMQKWIKAGLVSIVIFVLFSVYLFLRRGYYNLYIINKVFASGAGVLAGLTLLIGPLSEKWKAYRQYLSIRRHLGLLAFGFGLTHVVASLAQSSRFNSTFYLAQWQPVLFGFLALLLWSYLAFISTNDKVQKMGYEVWSKHQKFFGKAAFVLVFLHLTVMKYQGWIKWFQGAVKTTPELANPSYPPASLFVAGFIVLVIVFRVIYYYFGKKR